MEESDSFYLEAARQNDSGAFDFLVEKYQSRLYNLMYYYTGNREDALECVQETFLQFYTKIASFRGESALFTWLSRIAINLAISRKRKKKPILEENIFYMEQKLPETELIRQEVVAHVRRAIMDLPDEFRQVILLRDMEGLEYQVISDILEIPLGTVKSRIYRARDILAKELKDV
ncbi:MAG: sigma-70 family RNA polymerase sigma factor [Planctomycetia bacterium]|nr:sigma-70 family RNA polymerase sigma factor [Planctomycetia bacterium]